MESIPTEILAYILNGASLRVVFALYRANRRFREIVPELVRYTCDKPFVLRHELTAVLLSFPNLRRAYGALLTVAPKRGADSLHKIPVHLEHATFLCPEYVCPFLIQRLRDIDEKFSKRSWTFGYGDVLPELGTSCVVSWITAKDDRFEDGECGDTPLAYYLNGGKTASEDRTTFIGKHVLEHYDNTYLPSPLLLDMLKTGEMGHVDPSDPGSPLVRDVLCKDGEYRSIEDDEILVSIAACVEYIRHGWSPLLKRWSVILGGVLVDPARLNGEISLDLIEKAPMPRASPPSSREEYKKRSEVIQRLITSAKAGPGYFGNDDEIVDLRSPTISKEPQLESFGRFVRTFGYERIPAHIPAPDPPSLESAFAIERREFLLSRVEKAQAEGKVLDVSNMDESFTGTRIVKRPGPRSQKKGPPSIAVISDNDETFDLAMAALHEREWIGRRLG